MYQTKLQWEPALGQALMGTSEDPIYIKESRLEVKKKTLYVRINACTYLCMLFCACPHIHTNQNTQVVSPTDESLYVQKWSLHSTRASGIIL